MAVRAVPLSQAPQETPQPALATPHHDRVVGPEHRPCDRRQGPEQPFVHPDVLADLQPYAGTPGPEPPPGDTFEVAGEADQHPPGRQVLLTAVHPERQRVRQQRPADDLRGVVVDPADTVDVRPPQGVRTRVRDDVEDRRRRRYPQRPHAAEPVETHAGRVTGTDTSLRLSSVITSTDFTSFGDTSAAPSRLVPLLSPFSVTSQLPAIRW